MSIKLHTTPKTILVMYITRIGDTMLITPLVRALAHAWPSAHIDFLGSRTSAEVFFHLPFIRHVGSLKKRWVYFQGILQPKTYDLAVVAGFDGDGPFVEYALRRAKQVIAFRQIKQSLNPKLFAAIEKPPFQSCHAVDHLLSLIKPLEIPTDGKYLSYHVSKAERKWARARIAPVRIYGAFPLIGVQISSFPTKGYRDWPVKQFIKLCRRIRAEYPKSYFLIFGGKLEHERTHALQIALLDHSINYSGRLSLRQTGALMNELDLYIGVDTGPTHIMGALHRPMIAIYHGSSPSTLLAPLEHPCLWTVDHPSAGQGYKPDGYPMDEISVDTVMTKVREALA